MEVGNKIMHVADGVFYDMNDFKTKRNNNVMVFGASGTSKTRSIVIPNILQATGSYVISDPKGALYKDYKDYLIRKGYYVYNINLKETHKSNYFNPFAYIKDEQGILKVASILVGKEDAGQTNSKFFTNAGKYLLASIIAFVKYELCVVYHNFACVAEILSTGWVQNMDVTPTVREYLKTLTNKDGKPIWTDEELYNIDMVPIDIKKYLKFRQAKSPSVASKLFSICTSGNAKETVDCIFMEALNAVNIFNFHGINLLTSRSEFDFEMLATRRTAIFISCSDTDRSLDPLCNLIYTQILQVLCDYADNKCKEHRLKIDVRFILDDFATNYKIVDFDKSITMIRSRGISATIIAQDYNQLEYAYGIAGKTICNNCDTWVFLGANDYNTASIMAKQVNTTTEKLMDMKIGECYIYRRAEKTKHTKVINLDKFKKIIRRKNGIIINYRAINEKSKQVGFHI